MGVLGQILRASLSRYVVALEFPEFRTMWMANLAAQAAAWALIVSRGWLVFDMTRSSFAVALVTFAAMVPQLFMPPIAGVLADRMSRRDLMGMTYGVNLLTNLVLAILAATGVIVEWQIVVLSVINGAARATQQSTSQALAANLVPEDRLLNALSLSASTQHMARLVGPGLGVRVEPADASASVDGDPLSRRSPTLVSANLVWLSLSLPSVNRRLACSWTTPAASWTVGWSFIFRAAVTSSSYFSRPARVPRTNPAARPPRNHSLPRMRPPPSGDASVAV